MKLIANQIIAVVTGLILVVGLLAPTPISAVDFNPNRIMDDNIFNDSSSWNAAQIDNFLNSFPSSCIGTNRGFSAPDVVGYNPSQGFLYGSNVSAGTIINNAAKAYDLNPKVLLATLQKEQSLVTGTAGCHYETPSNLDPCPEKPYGTVNPCVIACQYSGGCIYIALGYDCPRYCVPASVGFSKQIIKAAWKLKFVQQRSLGNYNWNIQKPGWDNSDDPATEYNGYMTQGTRKRNAYSTPTYYDGNRPVNSNSLTVHLDTGATASLYSYTPFTSGNQSFVNRWSDFGFGPTTGTAKPYTWSVSSVDVYADQARSIKFSRSPIVDLQPGGLAYVTLRVENTGYETWSQSIVHGGTTYPRDRISKFANGTWLSNQRLGMQETSVAPGETGTFTFSITAPNTPGTYIEHLSLVADGITWMNDPNFYLTINVTTVSTPSNTQNTGLTTGQFLTPGKRLLSPDAQSVFTLLPNGKVAMYGDFIQQWDNGVINNDAQSLVLQADGNLVEYDSNGNPLWSTGTSGAGNYLALQTDGNVVLYSSNNVPLWSTGTVSIPNHLNKVNVSLYYGGVLYPGQFIQTADRSHTLVLQNDGNLVEYDSSGWPVWFSNTRGEDNVLVSQNDGNIVLYNKSGQAVWASSTRGAGSALTIQQSGVITVTNGNNSILLAKQAVRAGQFIQTADRSHTLVLQNDGNLVLYDNSGHPVWNTGTRGIGNVFTVQSDGNAVLYSNNGRPLWNTGTRGIGNVFTVQSDGNLVVYANNGSPFWSRL